MLEKIVVILLMAGLLVLLFHRLRHNPEAFSLHNLSRSTTVLGVLALGLMAFIWILVMVLKSH